MSVVGFKARNHPQQTNLRGADDLVDDRGTHPDNFGPWNERFGGFTLDVAAAPHNTKCERFFTQADDGLAQSWAGEKVWCNPPYSNLNAWLEKAWAEYPKTRGIVMLLPANRVEQRWWQDHVEPFRDRADSPLTVEFLPGRMRFIKPGQTAIGPNERPPFGCALLIWKDPNVRSNFLAQRLAETEAERYAARALIERLRAGIKLIGPDEITPTGARTLNSILADGPRAREPEREALARVIWETSRADEGSISATGANIVADAILAHLAARQTINQEGTK